VNHNETDEDILNHIEDVK